MAYGYTPSLAMSVIFMVLFSLTSVVHEIQAYLWIGHRWMCVMTVGALLEVAGWGFRLWSYFDLEGPGYKAQIALLVIAPTFFSAALYMLLGTLIAMLNPAGSYLSAKWFKIIFIGADVVSLVVQAGGGGIAATADDEKMSDMGSNIMLVGIIVQLVVMVAYVAYGSWWSWRSRRAIKLAGAGISYIMFGMAIASVAIIARGIYRTAELVQGFNGAIAHNEMLFLLDPIPCVIACVALNIIHPCHFIGSYKSVSQTSSRTNMVEAGFDSKEVSQSELIRMEAV